MSKEKQLITLGLLLIASIHAKAQFIFGEVRDQETDSLIAFANIYFNNSFTGTTSGLDGHFKLHIGLNRGQAITVSCMGYHSQSIQDFSAGTFYRVYLSPKSNVLKELVIAPDDMPRKKKMKMFIKEFLGTSPNAKKCILENPDELRLLYFKSTHTLEAYSQAPLIIHNKALGYRITYFLEEFIHTGQRTYYKGTSIFEEDSSLNSKTLRKVIKRRREVYYGSRMHFFRALWQDRLTQENFEVSHSGDGHRLGCNELVVSHQQYFKYLSSRNPLTISYDHQMSSITFYQDVNIGFTENGFFDPEGHYWDGKMAEQRMGDYLPFEYMP